MNSQKKIVPYGSWESPIDAKRIIAGNCKDICELQVSPNGRVFWVEQTFPRGTRVLFERGDNTSNVRWSGDEITVANCTHEYGGGSFCVDDSRVYISTGRGIFELQEPGAEPIAILENGPNEDVRYADLFIHGCYIYAVEEAHTGPGEPKNSLIRVNTQTFKRQQIAEGADFYAAPRISPNGRFIAWIEWNKPYMPWDRTSLKVMELPEDDFLGREDQSLDQRINTILEGGSKTISEGFSYFGPKWVDQERLCVVGDPTGFWNVYLLNVNNADSIRNLTPITNQDVGEPFWVFANDRPYTLDENNIYFHLGDTLYMKSLSGCDEDETRQSLGREIWVLKDQGFSTLSHLCCAHEKLFAIASGPKRPCSLVQLDLKSNKIEILRETVPVKELEALPISVGQLQTFSSDGVDVQGYFYPPQSNSHIGPEGDAPPVLLLAHGGPTARTKDHLDLKKQFFTSRGWAVFDVNYRGSSGRGRAFRDMLLGNWGIADRNDMVNGAEYLIKNGLVNPKMVCIMGSSAGGFLVLSTLFHPNNPFSAAVSHYGVADLEDLFKVTHKFEGDYTVRLVAPYPEGRSVYHERSALHNLDKIRTPIAFLHGEDDPVVPCNESITCHDSIKNRGIRTLLKVFPGEKHGYKSSEAIIQSYEISYAFLCKILGLKPSIDCQIKIDNDKF